MKKVLSILVTLFMFASFGVAAQIFTSSPAILQEGSKNVVLTFHADKAGVAALLNKDVLYAHIGVYTNKSPNTWAHVKYDWNVDKEDNKFVKKTASTYELTIGDLRSYFGITDPAETITKVCVIARTPKNVSPAGQTSDQFLDVYPDGYQMQFTNNAASTVFTEATTINFNVDVTETSSITLKVNGEVKATANGTNLNKDIAFTAKGAYEVVATATAGGNTKTETVSILYISNSPQANYPGGTPKMGAVDNPDGSVTFCLAAPGKSTVMIVGSWDDYATLDKNVMAYQDYNGYRYFWITVNGLDDDTAYTYYFNVDGKYNVGDPYAKLTLDPYSDKWLGDDVFTDRPLYPYSRFDDRMLSVYQKNFYPYKWQCANFEIPAHEQLVIYELLLRDFTGTEGAHEGNGTIAKAIEKIPYLHQLGINAVELMPVMEFNGNNSWGYNTNFYFSLDKAYGSPLELKQFVDECHKCGIAVILDIVFNHSDGLHPWYQMYDPASNPFYNATAPHDWSVLNDWKQENPLVQQQWEDVIKFWMKEYNVDGYRFDLVKGLGTSYGSTDGYNASRFPVMQRLHNHIKAVKPNGIHINEFLGPEQEEIEYGNDGQLNWNNQNGTASNYAKGQSAATNVFNAMGSRPWGTVVSYMESHDEQRIAYNALVSGTPAIKTNTTTRTQRLGSLAAMMLFTPGPQMVWQFGELAADENTKNGNDNNTDPKTVIWSRLDDSDYKGLHDTYSDLMWLRRSNPELFSQNAQLTMTFAGSVQRSGKLVSGDKEVVILINPGVNERDISFSSANITATAYTLISKSHGMAEPTLTQSGTQLKAKIAPHCYAIFASKSVSGVEDAIADSSAAKVFGGKGQIIINGGYNDVKVYGVTGQQFGSLNVPSGVYIVNVDGAITKVVVK